MLKLLITFFLLPNLIFRRHGVSRSEHLRHTHLRVISGRDITLGEYSFVVVLIQIMDIHHPPIINRRCTASMISKNWVITAAHCSDYKLLAMLYIWYGNYTVPPLRTRLYSKVLEIFNHPAYHIFDADVSGAFLIDNDISLLRVREINDVNYARLSAVDHATMVGFPVIYVGAGDTNKPGDDEMRPLQVGEAAIISCDNKFRDMTKHLICITPKCEARQHRTASGDSGGPLLFGGNIVGVLSYGEDDQFIVRDGYAPISPYIDWIYEVMHSRK